MHYTPLSDAELQLIRQRCQHAFDRPLAILNLRDAAALCYSAEEAGGCRIVPVARFYGADRVAHARFVLQARQDLERLIAEVERLRASPSS